MTLKKYIFAFVFLYLIFQPETFFAQQNDNFKKIVETRLKLTYGTSLQKVCPVDSNATARRIFSEYGAIFISSGTSLPVRCIFSSEAELQDYQVRVPTQTVNLDGTTIILQTPAMEALLKARGEAAKRKLRISPRGGAIAAKRSFGDTIRLWNSRFHPALNYWVTKGTITQKEAEKIRVSKIPEQIEKVLEWESRGWFFSKDLAKSILFSVAAPGASQHNFMLALDVEQFASKEVRQILADHGWFQTIKSDMPHFTYLGVKEEELPSLGLKALIIGGQKFWIPDY
jgi:hypothetical protein